MAIAFGAVGAVAVGTTSLSVAYPANITAGQLLVLFVGNKYPTNAPATPSGFFAPSGNQYSRGGGTAGADTGDVYITVFLRIADGTETGNLSVTITGANTTIGIMFRVTKAAGVDWGYACAGGSDNTAGTAWSVTAGSNPGVVAGDMVFVGSTVCGNTDTATAEAITQTGVTFGSMVERQDSGSNTGDDISLWITEHPVNSGTGSANPVYTATVAGTGSATAAGASLFLRLREVAASQNVTPDFMGSGETFYSPKLNLNLNSSFISSTETIYTPTVSTGASGQNITPNFITSAETVYNPTLLRDQNIVPNFITSSEQIFSPKLNLNANLGFISSSEQIYTPQIILDQNVMPTFITSAEVVYTPTIGGDQNIVPDFIPSAESIYTLTLQIEQNITPNFISSQEQIFSPDVELTVTPNLIPSAESVYNPQINLTVYPNFISSQEQVFNPIVTIDQSVSSDLISSSEVVYNPNVSVSGGIQVIEPEFISSTTTIYAFQIKLALLPDFIGSAESIYSPKINQNLTPNFIGNLESVYSPTLIYNQSIIAGFTPSIEIVYNPIVSGAGNIFEGSLEMTFLAIPPSMEFDVVPPSMEFEVL